MGKLNPNEIKSLDKKQLVNMLQDEVFDDPDFIRHIKEVAEKEEVPLEVAETIIKKYITDCGKEMIKVKKHKRRIVLFGHLNIDIVEPKFNKFSIYFKKRKK